jgi:hypothetical protein
MPRSIPHQIQAAWAEVGKRPGEREDFGILAASRGAIDVSQIYEEFVAGVPSQSSDPSSAGAPPWVTFGTHTQAGTRLVSVAVQLWWEGLDQAGRPIWPRNFYAFRYEDMMASGASYRTIYDAVRSAGLPSQGSRSGRLEIEARSRRDGDSLPLEIQPPPPGVLENRIKRFGFERLAEVAAALLDQPVAVGGFGQLHLAERLDLLDAIAALLPYGFRVDLSASSAVSPVSTPAMRLILAEGRVGTHLAVEIGDTYRGAPAIPLSPMAREHRDMLLRKGQDGARLDRVVGFLWQDRGPHYFSRPASAVMSLRLLDRLSDLIQRLRMIEIIDVERTGEFFAEGPDFVAKYWESLPLPSRYRMLELVLESRDEAAAAGLVQSWHVVFPEIVELANDELDHGRLDLAVRSLAIAESELGAGVADKLLVQLLIPQATPGERGSGSWQERMHARVNLLLTRPVPRPGTFTTTRDALAFDEITNWQARLVLALLTSELARDSGAGRSRVAEWASWLRAAATPGIENRPDWARALDVASAPRGSVAAPAVIRSVTWAAPSWAALLIQLAGHAQNLPMVLGDLGPGLIDLALRQDDAAASARGDLAAVLAPALRSASVAEEDLACVDGARLILAVRTFECPDPAAEEAFQRYKDGLVQVLGHLRMQSESEHEERLQDRFLYSALPVRTDGQALLPLPRASVELIKSWSADPDRAPGLAETIDASEDDALVETLLRYDQLKPQEWRALGKYVPRLGPLGSAAQLRTAVQRLIASPARELARETVDFVDGSGVRKLCVPTSGLPAAMYEARCDGMEIRQILDVIGGTRLGDRGTTLMDRVKTADLWDVLLQFQSLLLHQPPVATRDGTHHRKGASGAQKDWRDCLDGIILERALDERCAEEFRDEVLYRAAGGEKIYKALGRRYARRRFGRRRARGRRALHPRRQAPDRQALDRGQSRSPAAAPGAARFQPGGQDRTTGQGPDNRGGYPRDDAHPPQPASAAQARQATSGTRSAADRHGAGTTLPALPEDHVTTAPVQRPSPRGLRLRMAGLFGRRERRPPPAGDDQEQSS